MPELRSDPWSWVFPDLLVDIIVLSFCDLWVAMKLKGTAYIPFFPECRAGFRRKGELRVSLLFRVLITMSIQAEAGGIFHRWERHGNKLLLLQLGSWTAR